MMQSKQANSSIILREQTIRYLYDKLMSSKLVATIMQQESNWSSVSLEGKLFVSSKRNKHNMAENQMQLIRGRKYVWTNLVVSVYSSKSRMGKHPSTVFYHVEFNVDSH